jgi:hypothetical protein
MLPTRRRRGPPLLLPRSNRLLSLQKEFLTAQTSAFCRAQQDDHLKRAAAASLENVRVIATKAAAAWGREAELAEIREAKRERENALPAAASADEEADDLTFSENPYLGRSS